MTIAAGLIVSRFVHYLALSILFGGALFPFYGFESPQDTQRVSAWLRALLLASALLTWLSGISWYQHTIFARAEDAEKNELFGSGNPLQGRIFEVSKFSLGYVYDIPVGEHFSLGLGALGSLYALPSALGPAYGSSPSSYMAFTRVKLK